MATVMIPDYAVGECEIKSMGWNKPRRFAVVRERIRDSKPSMGKKLIDPPEYTFRVLVNQLARFPGRDLAYITAPTWRTGLPS